MSVGIIFTDEFENWWDNLTAQEQKSVGVAVELLEELGVMLGFPQCLSIQGSKKLRELRIQHHGEPYRVLYPFDFARNAVLLLGGNKAGNDRWFDQSILSQNKSLRRT